MNEIQCIRIEQCIIEPLRSGRYAQGREALEETLVNGRVKHCCLGVATREAIAAGCEINVITTYGTDRGGTQTMFDSCPGFLPPTVQEWYGLSEDPELPLPDGRSLSATTMNDGDNSRYPGVASASFPEIADAFQRLVDENRAMRAKHGLADI